MLVRVPLSAYFFMQPRQLNACYRCCYMFRKYIDHLHRAKIYIDLYSTSSILTQLFGRACDVYNKEMMALDKQSLYKSVGTMLQLFLNLLTPNVNYGGRTAPLTSKVAFYIFIQQIQVLNILNMVYNLRFFFSSKCSLFHNSNVFGSCIVHILYTGCAKI